MIFYSVVLQVGIYSSYQVGDFMRDLLLKLLTYEPFEKIKDVEKDYIDFVVLEDEVRVIRPSYRIYYELLIIFEKIVDSEGKNIAGLKEWLDRYFEKAGGYLVYRSNGKRAYYPVLFKKICFYCLTEFEGITDKDFFNSIGMNPNLLAKWKISPAYRRKLNDNGTYRNLPMYRSGKKAEYLVTAVKAAYYEASRQYRGTEESLPKKKELLPFCDCFAGTGVVSASVDADKIIANDLDVGAATFLYAMAHDFREVRRRLVMLHTRFIYHTFNKKEFNLTQCWKPYTKAEWKVHKTNSGIKKYQVNDKKFDDFVIRARNNYRCIQSYYKVALKGYVPNFDNPSEQDIKGFYNIGVAWYFLNAFHSSNPANGFTVTAMDHASYYSYMKNKLGVDLPERCENDEKHIKIKTNLKAKNVKFSDGRAFMKAFHGATITSMDFRDFLKESEYGDGCFVYIDSPYFLTSGYNVGFSDQDHKDMLDLLRNAPYSWIFSMQYKKADYPGSATKSPVSGRTKYQRDGNPIIRSYGDYFKGFVKDFVVEVDKSKIPKKKENDENEREKHKQYVVNDPVQPDKKNPLYALLFKETKTNEMMICNFDVKRVFPYGGDVVVMPYSLFLDSLIDSKTGLCREYAELITIAEEYRKEDIIKNYEKGCLI